MSCLQDSFSFLREREASEQVRIELMDFLDGVDWENFLDTLTNETHVTKNATITTLVKRVKAGLLSPESIFKDCDPSQLVTSMGDQIDGEFLRIAVSVATKGSALALSFLESIIQIHPKEVIEQFKTWDIPDTEMRNIVLLFFSVLFRRKIRQIQEFLAEVPLRITIPSLYKYLTTRSDYGTDVILEFLLHISKRWGFFQELHEVVVQAIKDNSRDVLNLFLDLLEKGHHLSCFSYSEAFSSLFNGCFCHFLQTIFLQRAPTTGDTILQVQVELVDSDSSAKLKEVLRSRNEVCFPEAELVNLAEEFHKTKEIPVTISKKFMFNRKEVTNVLGPALRDLAKTNAMANELVLALEKKGMIAKVQSRVNWEATVNLLKQSDSAMTNMCEVLEEAKPDSNVYIPLLFNAFHTALFLRHSSDVVAFTDAFEMKVLKRMPFTTQEQLLMVAIEFLCSNLSEQHRWSLSILLSRCDMTKCAQRVFECSIEREIEILVFLHKAAIASASQIKLGCEGGDAMTDLTESVSHGIAKLPRLFIQRLRWRVLRGDTLDSVCWLPEFLLLADSDLSVFFAWECTQESSHEILSKLGITTTPHLYPKFLFTMLEMDPSESVCGVMIPQFSRIEKNDVIIPEKPNMRVLFQTGILWCSAVLCHPEVVACLRDPTLMMSQGLLRALPSDDVERLFSMFPHAFASMLYHFPMIYGEKPQSLVNTYQVVQGHFDAFQDPPRFAMVSIVSAWTRENRDLIDLTKRMPTRTCVSYCFIFAVCLHKHENAVSLLHGNAFLFDLLRQGFAEENCFFGQGKWTDSLIEFALYCAYNDVSFGNTEKWKHFLQLVKVSSWPDSLLVDNENLRVLTRYGEKYA